IAQGFTEPFPIIGHSLGGNIALYYTASQPQHVSKLIVLEGLGFSQEAYDKTLARPMEERWGRAVDRRLNALKRQPRYFQGVEDGVKRMASLHPQLRVDQARHLALHALKETSQGHRWKHDPLLTFQPLRPSSPTEYTPLYQTIACPVLLMYGRDSWASSPKKDGRLDVFQNAQLIEYEGAGHWLHHDQFEAFIKDCRTFLAAPTPHHSSPV
ncbi:MAG: alpha/beta hydrolase, partial [Pseudomonadota bacterium]